MLSFFNVENRSSSFIMSVTGGMKCVKYLVFFFNFIFWVSSSNHISFIVKLGYEKKKQNTAEWTWKPPKTNCRKEDNTVV